MEFAFFKSRASYLDKKISLASITGSVLCKLDQRKTLPNSAKTGRTVLQISLLIRNVSQIYQASRPKLDAPTPQKNLG